MKDDLERAVIRLKNGDESAFNEIYDEVYRLVYYIAKQKIKRKEDIEEVTSDVMFTIYSKIDTLKDTSKFKSWVCMIAKNKAADKVESIETEEKHTKPLVDEDVVIDPDTNEALLNMKTGEALTVPKISTGDTIRKKQESDRINSLEYQQWFSDIQSFELQEQMEEVFGLLPERDREILLLHYEEGLKVKQIAEMYELSPSTVRSRLQQTTKVVRREFTERKKKGLLTFSIAPFFLFRLFRKTSSSLVIPKAAKAASIESIKANIASSGGYNTWTTSIPKVRAARRIATMSTLKKGIAGVVAVSIVAGGTAGVASIYANNENEDSAHEANEIRIVDTIESDNSSIQEDYIYSEITDASGNVIGIMLMECLLKGEVEIPTEYQGYKVLSINNSCFYEKSGITKITIPKGVKLEEGAFFRCDAQEIIFSDDLTELPDNAFAYSPKLKSIKMPAKLEKMGRNIFQDCVSLESVDFYNEGGLKKLGEQTFDGCEKLKEVILPDTIEEIGLAAFQNCKSLKTVHLPSELREIGSHVFFNCTSLTHIELPSKLETIAHSNFVNCPITELRFPSSLKRFFDDDAQFPEEASFKGSKIETLIFENNISVETFDIDYEIPTIKTIHMGNNFDLFKSGLGVSTESVMVNGIEGKRATWEMAHKDFKICTDNKDVYNKMKQYLTDEDENLFCYMVCDVVLCNGH